METLPRGLMHFISFILNLILWTILGIIIGAISLQGHKRKENLTLFVSTLSTLLGGAFAYTAHGTWVEFGVDFFNLFVALAVGISTVFVFVPERREAISFLFERGRTFLANSLTKRQENFGQLGRNFWENITSTLSFR